MRRLVPGSGRDLSTIETFDLMSSLSNSLRFENDIRRLRPQFNLSELQIAYLLYISLNMFPFDVIFLYIAFY